MDCIFELFFEFVLLQAFLDIFCFAVCFILIIKGREILVIYSIYMDHVLEFDYPPNSALDFPIELEEHNFRLKNGDIILMKKNSFTFLVAKKRQKKDAKFSLEKIIFDSNFETTKRTDFKISFTPSPGVTSINPWIIHDAAFDAVVKQFGF
jgi:hypothetical protein